MWNQARESSGGWGTLDQRLPLAQYLFPHQAPRFIWMAPEDTLSICEVLCRK